MHIGEARTLADKHWGSSSDAYNAALASLAIVHMYKGEYNAAEALLLRVHPSLLLPGHHCAITSTLLVHS